VAQVNTRARTLGSALGTAASNLGAAATALALSIVVARSLGPAMKGSFDLMTAAAAFAALAFGLGVPIGITLVVAKRPEEARRVPYPAALLSLVIGALTAVVVAAWSELAGGSGSRPGGRSFDEAIAVGALAAITAYTAIAESALIGSRRIGIANLTDLVGRLLGLGIVIALSTSATPTTLVLAVSLGLFVGGAMQTAALRPQGWLSRPDVAATVRQAVPAYISSGMQLANYRVDLFIVALVWGPIQVGLYAVAGLLAQLVWVLARGGAVALYPLFAVDDDPAVGTRRLAEASRLATVVGIVGSIMLAIAAPALIPVVYGDDFAEAVQPLWLLLPGVALFSPAIVASAFFLGRGTPGKNVITSGIGLIVTVTLDLVLVPRYGMAGAAIASTASYATTAVATLILLQRATGLRLTDLLVPRRQDLDQLLVATRVLARRPRRA
jgi:O-antigen/teichoic acid export membrane protein